MDECSADETNDCDPNALCNNTNGSYTCRCKEGYTGNGRNCSGNASRVPTNPNHDFFCLMVIKEACEGVLLFCHPAIPTLISFSSIYIWSCILSVFACFFFFCFVFYRASLENLRQFVLFLATSSLLSSHCVIPPPSERYAG